MSAPPSTNDIPIFATSPSSIGSWLHEIREHITMTTASTLQSLLRFLSQDAKIPLATCMSKVQALQSADLSSTEQLSKAKHTDLIPIFEDEKLCKQVISAAKRVLKKRLASGGDDVAAPPSRKKKPRNESLFSEKATEPTDLEESLRLPTSDLNESELQDVVLFTNRAPLVLAFLVVLLKHTMPEQPLSSRLSLAQAYVSLTSRSRAIYLGIEGGKSAEDEGFGAGQPSVTVAGKEVKILKRWGYEWREEGSAIKTKRDTSRDEAGAVKDEDGAVNDGDGADEKEVEVDVNAGLPEEKPAIWALDLEALKKSDSVDARRAGTQSNLPVHTPQAARAYIMKAFETAPSDDAPTSAKKPTAAMKAAEKEANLGKLLRALELLYDSWVTTLSSTELDSRTWSWYVKVRPTVASGAEGWGGKNQLRLADILALRRSGWRD